MGWAYGNRYLSQSEMENNARIVQSYGMTEGWTRNAICAILGNMEEESTINPGIWGDYDSSNIPHAYGLTQWNPYTKYSNWAGSGWQNNGNKQLARISYEITNNLQWFYNSQIGMAPPYTFSAFVTDSTTALGTMADYFCWFYEHPTNPNQPARAANAQYWYDFLNWTDPPDPPPPDPPSHLPYWLLFKFRGRKIQA